MKSSNLHAAHLSRPCTEAPDFSRLAALGKATPVWKGSDTKQPLAVAWSWQKLWLAPLWLLALACATLAEAQQLVISNYGTTNQVLRLNLGHGDVRIPVPAGSAVTVPVPAETSVGVDTDDPGSWGSSGFTTGPAGSVQYITVTNGNAYYMEDDWQIYPVAQGVTGGAGGSSEGTGITMAQIITPLAAGFGLMVLPLLTVLMMRAIKRGTSIDGGNLT